MNGMPANGPPCDLNSAFSVAESMGLTVPSMRTPWTGSVAVRCHPWRGMPGSMSTSCNCSGRATAANSCQEGAWNPADAGFSPEARTPSKWKEGCWAWKASTMRAQTVGCLWWIISKQSAQLAQKAGLASNVALRSPRPPRHSGKLA